MTLADWKDARNLLCVRLDAMGDVLMTTPALRALKNGIDRCRITLLTSRAGAEAAALVPEVDEVLTFAAPWMKSSPAPARPRADFDAMEALYHRRFDGAVIFTVYSQNPLPAAYLCHLAGIPLRLAHCRENPYQLLTHWVKDPEPDGGLRHEVRRQLDLARSIGCECPDERLSLRFSDAARLKVRELLRRLGVDLSRPWAAVHPGASAPSRRYPEAHFAAAAAQLAAEDGMQIVFTGGPDEKDLVAGIQRAMNAPSFSAAGLLNLEELAALIAQAPVLISNNSGPAHVAAAVGTPLVDLYALTNPQHTPWAVPHRLLFHDVPCKNCYKSLCPEGHQECLAKVPPEAVARAARELTEGVSNAYARH